MIKRVSLPVIACAFLCNGYAQNMSNKDTQSRIIKIDSLYNYHGVIFNRSYKTPILINNLFDRFDPSENDIIVAENIFASEYNIANEECSATKGMQIIDNPKKYFKNFIRQYFGYIDSNGDKNLIMHLIDQSRKGNFEEYVGDGWKNNFVIFLSEEPLIDIYTYRADLTRKKLYATF